MNSANHFFQKTSLEDAITLPATCYFGDEFHQRDLATIFSKSWQCVGHQAQLSNKGDLIVAEIAGKPIIVVRDHNDQLRGYFNVCKHRAGPLATTNGNVKVLSCKYHGWSYQLSGELRTAPEMSDTPNFDLCQVHLDAIQVAQWGGLIFATLDPSPVPIETVFSGIDDIIAPVKHDTMSFHHREEYLIHCNWKVYLDNYLEGYHLPHVHPGLNKLLDYRSYTTHLSEWYSFQYSPLESETNFYGNGKAHYFCVYPNLLLNILPGRSQVNIILPVSHNKCKVIFDYYYQDLESPETKKMIEQDLSFSDQVQKEDIEICEHVQRGLESGAYHQGRLCVKREQGVWHFQELVRRAYRTHITVSESD